MGKIIAGLTNVKIKLMDRRYEIMIKDKLKLCNWLTLLVTLL